MEGSMKKLTRKQKFLHKIKLVLDYYRKHHPKGIRKIEHRDALHTIIYDMLADYRISTGRCDRYGQAYYISEHPTSDKKWNYSTLCGCNKLEYNRNDAIHITFGNCSSKRTKKAICIPYKTLRISQHKIGECPHTKYKESYKYIEQT